MKIMTVLFWIALVASSCQDDFVNEQDENFFPRSIGTTWTYKVYDSIAKSSEKVEVKITGSSSYNGKKVSRWHYTFESGTEYTLHVVAEKDKIEFYADEGLSEFIKVLILPLEVGKKWSTPGVINDVTEVIKKENLTVAGRVFNDAYEVYREVNSFNYYIKDDTWINPKVGILKTNYKEFDLLPLKNTSWELLEYKIK